MRRLFYTLLIMTGLLLLETVLVALSTGYLFIQFKSPLIENFGFFLALAGEDPLSTIKLLIADKPLFIIHSQHSTAASTRWALHYFSLTVLVHVVLAFLLAGIVARKGAAGRLEHIPVTGIALLILSTLYLRLAACCTGGPNWIVQSWLLAIVFNPVTSSNATIQLYQSIKDWFIVLQVISGGMGAYMLFRYLKKTF